MAYKVKSLKSSFNYLYADITINSGTTIADRLNLLFSQIDKNKITLKSKLEYGVVIASIDCIDLNTEYYRFSSPWGNANPAIGIGSYTCTKSGSYAVEISITSNGSIANNISGNTALYPFKLYY